MATFFTAMSGTSDLAIGTSVIPASVLGDITPNLTQDTRSSERMTGTVTSPANRYSEATLTFTIFPPSMDYMKAVWADAYNAKSGTGTSGNIVLGAGSCISKTPVPINIHPICDTNSNNDQHFYGGIVAMNWNPTLNGTDDISVEVTIHLQPNEDGNYGQIGAGDLTQETLYDAVTGTWTPVV